MSILVLYATTYNCTKKIVNNIIFNIPEVSILCLNVKDISNYTIDFKDYFCVVFCVPTYGCEELHEDMETFLLNCNNKLQGLSFTIIETGNYYGYDDFTFGAKRILLRQLEQNNCKVFCDCLSLDTFPRVDHNQLKRWLHYFKTCLIN